MNAVEFFFALSAVTFMTSIIYLWTRFVYKLDAQQQDEPFRRKTSSARVQPRAQDAEPYELPPGQIAATRVIERPL